MIFYLQIYCVLGMILGVGVYFCQYEKSTQFSLRINKSIYGDKKWHYKVREKLAIPGVILLITLCWPIAIYMVITELIKKKMNNQSEKSQYSFIARKEDLLEECDILNIEIQNIYLDPLGAVPKTPFGHLNKAWTQFISHKTLGDKLKIFRSPKSILYGDYGDLLDTDITGYVIVRDGEIVSEFIYESY